MSQRNAARTDGMQESALESRADRKGSGAGVGAYAGIDAKADGEADVEADAETKDTQLLMQQLMYLTNKRKTAEGWSEEDFALALEIGAITDATASRG